MTGFNRWFYRLDWLLVYLFNFQYLTMPCLSWLFWISLFLYLFYHTVMLLWYFILFIFFMVLYMKFYTSTVCIKFTQFYDCNTWMNCSITLRATVDRASHGLFPGLCYPTKWLVTTYWRMAFVEYIARYYYCIVLYYVLTCCILLLSVTICIKI